VDGQDSNWDAGEQVNFKVALIHAEQKPSYLKKRLAEGRIKPLHPAPELEINAGYGVGVTNASLGRLFKSTIGWIF